MHNMPLFNESVFANHLQGDVSVYCWLSFKKKKFQIRKMKPKKKRMRK